MARCNLPDCVLVLQVLRLDSDGIAAQIHRSQFESKPAVANNSTIKPGSIHQPPFHCSFMLNASARARSGSASAPPALAAPPAAVVLAAASALA